MAEKILYVSGYNTKKTTQHMLEELFIQAGPIRSVTMYEARAQICFQDVESVPYCLALFQGLELHGNRLRFQVKYYQKNTHELVHHLAKVRDVWRQQNLNTPPPNLPPKNYPADDHSRVQKRKHSSQDDTNKSKKTKFNKVRQFEAKQGDFRDRPADNDIHKPKKKSSPAKKGKSSPAKKGKRPPARSNLVRDPNGMKKKKKNNTKKKRTTRQR